MLFGRDDNLGSRNMILTMLSMNSKNVTNILKYLSRGPADLEPTFFQVNFGVEPSQQLIHIKGIKQRFNG